MTESTDSRSGGEERQSDVDRPGTEILTNDAAAGRDEITLLGLWDIFWSQRFLIIAIGSLFAIGSIVVALRMTPIYRADSVLAPVDAGDMPDIAGSIANLAGIRLGGSSADNSAVAILRSRDFAAEFISEKNLMPLFFEDSWDPEAEDWVYSNPDDVPELYDAIEYFHDSVFSVKEDPVSGLVTVAIEWKDPELAAEWVNELVGRINSKTRARDLEDANAKLAYLKGQLEAASVLELRSAISRLIESELKTIMIANARVEHAFEIIDPGMVPTKRIRPRRSLIVMVSTFLGGLLALVVAMTRHTLRNSRHEGK